MSKNEMVDETMEGLSQAIASGLLPEKAARAAETLRARLRAPIRVTIMGLPDTGKSRVLALLAGQEIVPVGVRLPALRLVWGEAETTRIKRADGTSETRDGLQGQWAMERRAVMVEMTAPLPALKRISLMEIGIGLGRTEQVRACGWAARQSELIVWCTRDFGAAEQSAWRTMPDVIRDQAILLRPKIDLSPNPAAALDRAHRLARDEFEKVLAIDTPRALDARHGGKVDREEFKASGGQPLIAAVLKVVDRMRQGYLDRADLILARHARDLERAEPSVAADSAPVAAAPAAPKPAAQAAAPVAQAAKAGPAVSEIGRARILEATAQLRLVGSELMGEDGETVLERSVDALSQLEESLADTSEPALADAYDDAQEALDLVQLMQVENDVNSADDAVVLMLQLRRRLDCIALAA
jgi:hypothetical protein